MNLPQDYQTKLSQYFTYHEALWLPQWKRYALPSDGLDDDVLDNLVFLFQKMDTVREFLGAPIIVHCAYRPYLYNAQVYGALNSAHLANAYQVAAVDFHVEQRNCDFVRNVIDQGNKLYEWEMRMEDKPGAAWIHLDTRQPPPGGNRYFKP